MTMSIKFLERIRCLGQLTNFMKLAQQSKKSEKTKIDKDDEFY